MMDEKEKEKELIKQAIIEIARYDYKYNNKYLKSERNLIFQVSEEEKKQYENNIKFLKDKKILNEKEQFIYSNGPDERIYYMYYCLESDSIKENNGV